MIGGLFLFLLGALVLVVVVIVTKLIIDQIPAAAPIKTIIWLILGLIFLLVLIALVMHAFGGALGVDKLGL